MLNLGYHAAVKKLGTADAGPFATGTLQPGEIINLARRAVIPSAGWQRANAMQHGHEADEADARSALPWERRKPRGSPGQGAHSRQYPPKM